MSSGAFSELEPRSKLMRIRGFLQDSSLRTAYEDDVTEGLGNHVVFAPTKERLRNALQDIFCDESKGTPAPIILTQSGVKDYTVTWGVSTGSRVVSARTFNDILLDILGEGPSATLTATDSWEGGRTRGDDAINIQAVLDAETSLQKALVLRVGCRVIFTVKTLVVLEGKRGQQVPVLPGQFGIVREINTRRRLLKVSIEPKARNWDGASPNPRNMLVIVRQERMTSYTKHTRLGRATRRQYPLILGYSLSLHQSCGMRFESAILALGRPELPGSLISAFDRVKNWNSGLWILACDEKEVSPKQYISKLLAVAKRPVADSPDLYNELDC
jgi:hypothetical protein